MRFTDTSKTRPGYLIYEADDKQHPGHHYTIQRKAGNDSALWLVAFREDDSEPLRIIYTTTSLPDAKKYANNYATQQS